MYLHVLFKIRSRGKLFPTEVARIWLLPSVDTLVADQVTNL
jgi:hypothetical protein